MRLARCSPETGWRQVAVYASHNSGGSFAASRRGMRPTSQVVGIAKRVRRIFYNNVVYIYIYIYIRCAGKLPRCPFCRWNWSMQRVSPSFFPPNTRYFSPRVSTISVSRSSQSAERRVYWDGTPVGDMTRVSSSPDRQVNERETETETANRKLLRQRPKIISGKILYSQGKKLKNKNDNNNSLIVADMFLKMREYFHFV